MNEYWSDVDKEKMLDLLKKYGPARIKLIQQEIPHRSESEIQFLIDKYSKLAQNRWHENEITLFDDSSAIEKWANVMNKIKASYRESVHDVLPRVLKYIALFEEDKQMDNTAVNLSECYKNLSELASGLPTKDLDPMNEHLIFDCLKKLSYGMKLQDIDGYKDFVKSIEDIADLTKEEAPKNIEDKRKRGVVNPLKLPDDLLKASEYDEQCSDYKNEQLVKKKSSRLVVNTREILITVE